MKKDYVIKSNNRYIAYVVVTAYVILFIFLLPQQFLKEEIINTSTEVIEQVEENRHYISGVPIINQFPELPTGCEVTSSAMLLNFYDVVVSKEELAEKVSKAPLPRFNKGRVEGESPNEYFIGSPWDPKGFGALNKPIFNLINSYKSAINITGCEFNEVIERVKNNQPVMAWITIDLEEVKYASSWYVGDEVYWWPSGEHTVVVTGVEESVIIVNDPYGGEERRFDLEQFKRIWEAMGRQAIVICE